jgi:methylated-DNA-[protein]-cysteine S-methyltransferase
LAETYTTYYHSPLGLLKISGTEEFITEVTFADDSDEKVPISNNLPPLIIQCIEEFIQYFQGDRRSFDVPIDFTGTSFQKGVWNELATIPFGRTISYLDLAIRTGDPKATRAVANANGRNNLAIIIPCHRVIGSNRTLVGYAGGLWRKKWLLEHELKVAYGVQTLF